MWACAIWLPRFTVDWAFAPTLARGLVLAGFGVALSGVLSFRRHRTTVNPMNPERASSLVRLGIYRYTRNPMYLGMLLLLGGWFFHLQNLAAGVFPPFYVAVLTELQIRPEERALTELFGEEYEGYLRATPRWLIC